MYSMNNLNKIMAHGNRKTCNNKFHTDRRELKCKVTGVSLSKTRCHYCSVLVSSRSNVKRDFKIELK